MKVFTLFLILLSCSSFAGQNIVLVAHKNTPIEDYKKICAKNSYICFPKGFSLTQRKNTPVFDSLVENFDLDNKDYVSQFTTKLSESLKNDDLNIDQIKNLILAAEKITSNKDNKPNEMIKKLKKFLAIVTNLPEEESDKILFVAGKAVPHSLANRLALDTYLNDLKHTEVDFYSFTENGEKKLFLNGDCDRPRYTEFISQLDLQVIPHFSEGCNFNQKYEWGADLLTAHFSENKNKYLVGLATLATVLFLNSYEITSDSK